MGTFAKSLAKNTLSLIAKYGDSITISRATAAAYDPTQGSAAVTFSTPVAVKAIVQDYDGRLFGQSNSNVLIKTGDKQLLIAAKNFTKPNIADVFAIGGVNHMIVPLREGGLEIITEGAQDIDMLYTIHVRKS